MIFDSTKATIDFTKMENIPECVEEFPVACYKHSRHYVTDPWHWHNEFEFGYVTEGNVVIKSENEKHVVSPGNGYFISPETLHSYESYDEGKVTLFVIVFRKDLVCGKDNSVFNRKYVLPITKRSDLKSCLLSQNNKYHSHIINLLKEIFELSEEENSYYEIEVRNKLTKIFVEMVNSLPKEENEVAETKNVSATKTKTMLLYIWQNYTKEITLSDIAKAGAVSNNACLLHFNETVGISPIQYLKNYRLEKAASLLMSTDRKIVEIVDLCGFKDKSYFTRAFKNKYNMSPTQFRKEFQKS